MPLTLSQAWLRFTSLVADGSAHENIIDLLESVRAEVDLAYEDLGWVFWNLCDRYACLRQEPRQYSYQCEFWQLCADSFPSRLHWVVSDGTQALTLITGGYQSQWWDWYQTANRLCSRTPENRTVRFESHRANTAAYISLRDMEKSQIALDELADIVDINLSDNSIPLEYLIDGEHDENSLP